MLQLRGSDRIPDEPGILTRRSGVADYCLVQRPVCDHIADAAAQPTFVFERHKAGTVAAKSIGEIARIDSRRLAPFQMRRYGPPGDRQ